MGAIVLVEGSGAAGEWRPHPLQRASERPDWRRSWPTPSQLSLPDEIYVVTIPIERTKGDYRYRATVEVPEVFNGAGVLARLDATIGRRYRFKGR